MARYSDAFLDELRSRVNLEEIVSQYVPLKQKGRRFWGCCPFHHEKTPSFSVDTEEQMYYCFGCHKGGTAIQFVMEMERLNFQEAVQNLAERAHMPVPAQSAGDNRPFVTSQEREDIYAANVAAARYFHAMLWKPEGAKILNYFYGRGLNDSDLRHFGLGAAPAGRDNLLKYLQGEGFEAETLRKAGLVVERDGHFSDMFRERAIFPIIDAHGKVLGFGGRAMGDAQPKYLNTPETPVFNKRKGLYSMNFVQKERDVGRLVLVEGYMDTVSLRKYGVRGVVATCGTALTEEQARLIRRYAPEVWISYDGDSAGRKAALRALDIFDTLPDMRPRVLDYPKGQDPDDFIRANGPEGFDRLHRYDAAEYRMLRARDELDLQTQEGMTQYAMDCCSILRKVRNPIERENHLRRLINETGYDRDTLLQQIGVSAQVQSPVRERRPLRRETRQEYVGAPAEKVLLTLLASNRIPREMVHEEDFEGEMYRRAARWLLSGKRIGALVETLEEEDERSALMEAVNYSPIPEDREEVLKLARTSMDEIRRARLENSMREINEKINTADASQKAMLYARMQDITQALEELTGRKESL